MIIRCACGADPGGRWKKPAMCIFVDPYAKDAATSSRGYAYACREHLSMRRETEIKEYEAAHGWAKGTLR